MPITSSWDVTTVKLIGLGSNLDSPVLGAPRDNCEAAIDRLSALGLSPLRRSGWYFSAPVPVSDQGWFVNGVLSIETDLGPRQALSVCQKIELEMGRVRSVDNGPRIIDIDILAWDDEILTETGLQLPHPRLSERAFVLFPLADIAPDWRHPSTGQTVTALINGLEPGQEIEKMA
jgi:2-amino-4-hydroxy-6-hydroxymethyldihydropteridine diphosphokinase